jgi:nitroreductase
MRLLSLVLALLSALTSALTFSKKSNPPYLFDDGVVNPLSTRHAKRKRSSIIDPLFSSNQDSSTETDCSSAFTTIMNNRYACTRFERYDGVKNSTTTASVPNATVVQMATQILDTARRAPSGFNAQPYRCIVVSSPEAKEKLSKYCIGHNAHRVRDSDCTVVFLANREVFWDLARIRNLVQSSRKMGKWKLRKYLALVLLFSQGLPFPKFLAGPISFFVRLATSILAFFTRSKFPLPSLYSAEVWSQKNTMLLAMSYLLGCTANQLQTCPMEGYNVAGIRRMLQIPRRYTIPLIVATGKAYEYGEKEYNDDAGVSHGPASGKNSKGSTPRFPLEDVIFGDSYGGALPQS